VRVFLLYNSASWCSYFEDLFFSRHVDVYKESLLMMSMLWCADHCW